MMTISLIVGFLVPVFEIATIRAKFAVSRLTFSAAFKADLFTVTLFGFFGGMGFLRILFLAYSELYVPTSWSSADSVNKPSKQVDSSHTVSCPP